MCSWEFSELKSTSVLTIYIKNLSLRWKHRSVVFRTGNLIPPGEFEQHDQFTRSQLSSFAFCPNVSKRLILNSHSVPPIRNSPGIDWHFTLKMCQVCAMHSALAAARRLCRIRLGTRVRIESGNFQIESSRNLSFFRVSNIKPNYVDAWRSFVLIFSGYTNPVKNSSDSLTRSLMHKHCRERLIGYASCDMHNCTCMSKKSFIWSYFCLPLEYSHSPILTLINFNQYRLFAIHWA